MGPTPHDHERHICGESLTRPEDGRYPLIDGMAHPMAPHPPWGTRWWSATSFQLRQALTERPCRVLIAPMDVLLPKADAAVDTVVQPDVLVVCEPAKVRERHVRGAPNLVVEVLSPATSVLDQIVKRRHYERSGMRELWLTHPLDRLLTLYRLEGGRYGMPETRPLEGATPAGTLLGVVIDEDHLFAHLPPAEY